MKDTARVLGRMYDGIEYRDFSQSIVEELRAMDVRLCAPKACFPREDLVAQCKDLASHTGAQVT